MTHILIIDGNPRLGSSFMKPLIDDLRFYAQGDAFESAVIREQDTTTLTEKGWRKATDDEQTEWSKTGQVPDNCQSSARLIAGSGLWVRPNLVSASVNYLVCDECGGAFDEINTATAHEFQDHKEQTLALDHVTYTIKAESEAM